MGRGSALGGSAKWLIVLFMVIASVVAYCSSSSFNDITNEKQYVSLSVEQEIALGLQSAPQMAAEFGGPDSNSQEQGVVKQVGQNILAATEAGQTPYKFSFTLLADDQTINAFALPGGPVFITSALYDRLQTEGQLAGVLGHEIGHVVARHSAEHIAKQQLTEGLAGAAVIASYDPNHPNSSQQAAAITAMIGQVVNMKFGREDELEADRLGVRFMAEAGYDPRSMLEVMKILAESSEGNRPPEFFSTHPNPENRIAAIEAAIKAEFPNGVPDGLIK
ncbi:MAG: M48 family metalloprotease [Anaerolineaceae bacterium]|nr:M48 family metalloprotease [Anaerolineaceae bacterium]